MVVPANGAWNKVLAGGKVFRFADVNKQGASGVPTRRDASAGDVDGVEA